MKRSMFFLGTVLVLTLLLAIPLTASAVDPDMQALVIDNGSGMCHEEPGNCSAVWKKIWKKADKADHHLSKAEALCAQAELKPSKARKVARLEDKVCELLVDLTVDAPNVSACCGVDEAFMDYFDSLSARHQDLCTP